MLETSVLNHQNTESEISLVEIAKEREQADLNEAFLHPNGKNLFSEIVHFLEQNPIEKNAIEQNEVVMKLPKGDMVALVIERNDVRWQDRKVVVAHPLLAWEQRDQYQDVIFVIAPDNKLDPKEDVLDRLPYAKRSEHYDFNSSIVLVKGNRLSKIQEEMSGYSFGIPHKINGALLEELIKNPETNISGVSYYNLVDTQRYDSYDAERRIQQNIARSALIALDCVPEWFRERSEQREDFATSGYTLLKELNARGLIHATISQNQNLIDGLKYYSVRGFDPTLQRTHFVAWAPEVCTVSSKIDTQLEGLLGKNVILQLVEKFKNESPSLSQDEVSIDLDARYALSMRIGPQTKAMWTMDMEAIRKGEKPMPYQLYYLSITDKTITDRNQDIQLKLSTGTSHLCPSRAELIKRLSEPNFLNQLQISYVYLDGMHELTQLPANKDKN